MSHQMTHFDLIDRSAVALKVIENRREPIYPEQRLVRGRGRRTAEGRRGPDMEHFRRQEIRRLIEELSRYYRLEDDEETWMAPALLRNGRHWSDNSTL